MASSSLTLLSPAKVNLYLHVTGKRDDGYHLLDSLAVFAKGAEDRIVLSEADEFHFNVRGPFAKDFSPQDLSTDQSASNLVVKAARRFSELSEIPLGISITLEKNLPMGAGLGGGSGDAAVTFHGLEQFYNVAINPETRHNTLLSLGADVPVCYEGKASRFEGIGEIITSPPAIPQTHILLVWPNAASLTKNVFARMEQSDYKPRANWPEEFPTTASFISFLQNTSNSMTRAAIEECPAIKVALEALKAQSGCLLSRMSGSGSCVFGLFESEDALLHARSRLLPSQPDWWIQPAQI